MSKILALLKSIENRQEILDKTTTCLIRDLNACLNIKKVYNKCYLGGKDGISSVNKSLLLIPSGE